MHQWSQETQGIVEFLVPPELDQAALIDAIGNAWLYVREPDTTRSCRIYDSFDWRLFAAGASLEWCFSEVPTLADPRTGLLEGLHPQRPMLRWRDLRAPHATLIQQPSDTEPGLLEELADGPVRDRLARLLEMRRLLPRVDVISQQTPLRLLNEDEKTVVRLLIEQHRFREPRSGRGGALSRRLLLKAVRGYLDAFEQARTGLIEQLGMSALTEALAQEALTAAGHCPGTYSTKLDERLDPNQRADLATKQILRGLLETLEANVEGTRQNLDSEFLHDLRVATRRTRAALSQIKGVFPEAVVTEFKQGFAWLQQVTGPVRDLDVYLLDFPSLEQRVPPMLRHELRPLYAQLLRQHGEAQCQLAHELDSVRFHRLLRDWRAFLDVPVPDAPAPDAPAPDAPVPDAPVPDAPVPDASSQSIRLEARADSVAAQPLGDETLEAGQRQQQGPAPKQAARLVKQVADQRIRKMLKRVRAEGRAIGADSAPEQLHELRKSCKKLRYLMEFFQSLYPKAKIREQIKQTKRLLDNLGRFQDTAVQAQHLYEQAAASAGGQGLPATTLLAMGALISQILNDQACARASFAEVFADFDSAENAERFKMLLQDPADQARAPAVMADAVGDAGSEPVKRKRPEPERNGGVGRASIAPEGPAPESPAPESPAPESTVRARR